MNNLKMARMCLIYLILAPFIHYSTRLKIEIHDAVWLYHRFNLSHRDIEDLLAERGITVSREAIRLWCIKFGGAIGGTHTLIDR